MPNLTCSIEGCEGARYQRGWCLMHYTRVRRTGSLEAPTQRVCATCGNSFTQTNITGPKPKYCSHECKPWKRKSVDGNCMGCSSPMPARQPGERMKKYCRPMCRSIKIRRPAPRPCTQCGEVIDMTLRMSSGKLRYPAYTRVCESCRKPNRYPLTASQLAERDGPACAGCGIEVDFTAIKPDPFSPSVDHVIPWSRGGANEAHNLQLMHLRCNVIKGTRLTN
jgi:hypothetical protein